VSVYNVALEPNNLIQVDPEGGVAGDSAAVWKHVRNVLVPQDIVGVRPRLPVRTKGHTAWRPRADDAGVVTARCGDREWFSDHLFCEAQDDHARSGFGTSITLHLIGVVALVIFLITRPDRLIAVRAPSLPMPAIVSPPPEMPTVTVESTPAESPKPQTKLMPPPPPPPAKTPDPGDAPPAPVEAPAGITAETGVETRTGGVEGGVAGGVPGGVVGGVVGGAIASGNGTAAPHVVRVGANMQPPKKTKDVKPVYPLGALPSRSQGAVVIEAIIGVDGRIQDAKVLHSVPGLDQAALDAVRQWEYTPSMLNGAPVAVVMTVVVNFAMQ